MGLFGKIPGMKERRLLPGNAALEWTVSVVGMILMLGSIGYLVFEGASGGRTSPSITLVQDEVLATDGGFLVRFTARNDGGETVSDLEVKGILFPPDAGAASEENAVETARAVLDFVPPASEHSGGFFFRHDPSLYGLELRASGYRDP